MNLFSLPIPFPSAVHGHDVVGTKDHIYVVGGTTTGLAAGNVTSIWSARMEDDHSVGAWAVAGGLPVALSLHRAVIHRGRIFVAGGQLSDGTLTANVYAAPLAPGGGVGVFQVVGQLNTTRTGHAMVVARGRLYVLGGTSSSIEYALINGDGSLGLFQTSAQTLSSPLNITAHALRGQIYVIGGSKTGVATALVCRARVLPDGSLSQIEKVGSLGQTRHGHLSLLDERGNQMVVAGGSPGPLASASPDVEVIRFGGDGVPLISASASSVAGGARWTRMTGVWGHSGSHVALLADGRVLIIGAGGDGAGASLNHTHCEVFDPVTGKFMATDDYPGLNVRLGMSFVLKDGRVLHGTGSDSAGTTWYNFWYVWDPATGNWTATDSTTFTGGLIYGSGVTLPDGRALLVEGQYNSSPMAPYLTVWNPNDGHWTAMTVCPTARRKPACTLLADGRVFVCGGRDDLATPQPLTACHILDPAGAAGAGSWTAAASMTNGRFDHSVVTLLDGRVMAIGGLSGAGMNDTATCEIYTPGSNTWAAAASVPIASSSAYVGLLPSGKVLRVGGYLNTVGDNEATLTNRCFLYDPILNTWTELASLQGEGRASGQGAHFPIAAVLPDGSFMAWGGFTQFISTVIRAKTLDITPDPDRRILVPAGTMPASLHCARGCLIRDRVVMVGGLDQTGAVSSSVYVGALGATP